MTQKQVNDVCMFVAGTVRYYFSEHEYVFKRRLRSCKAVVYAYDSETGRAYVLKSYNTPVALVDECGVCYDFLRYVYGYTATSAQHISKFFKDYAPANAERLTYRA